METERRAVGARGCGEGSGQLVLMGTEFWLEKMRKAPRVMAGMAARQREYSMPLMWPRNKWLKRQLRVPW